ncbi:hypothetical protein TraAM80_09276, partial [Trypanosoma rangeli]
MSLLLSLCIASPSRSVWVVSYDSRRHAHEYRCRVRVRRACRGHAASAQQLRARRRRRTVAQQTTRYGHTGVCALAAAACVGGAGVIVSWHYRRIYRVWRLRHPAFVAQQRRLMWFLAASEMMLLIFLLSPVGFMAQHK